MTNPAVRRAALMLVSTAAAIVGLVLLVVAWTDVAKTTIEATDAGRHPVPRRVRRRATGRSSRRSVHYEVLPPRVGVLVGGRR